MIKWTKGKCIFDVILWELKINKNATETAKKICSVYDKSVIFDRQA